MISIYGSPSFSSDFAPVTVSNNTQENCQAAYADYKSYTNLVKGYSSRQHTYHSDSLNAFQGALSSLNASYGWKFLSALPEDVFDLALLWRPMVIANLQPNRPTAHKIQLAEYRHGAGRLELAKSTRTTGALVPMH